MDGEPLGVLSVTLAEVASTEPSTEVDGEEEEKDVATLATTVLQRSRPPKWTESRWRHHRPDLMPTASTEPSTEVDGECASFFIYRHRRVCFNGAVHRSGRRDHAALGAAIVPFVASTEPSTEVDGELSLAS